MSTLVFVLGRAGSGKSTATRYMEMWIRDQGRDLERITDYRFLYDMFKNHDPRFRPTTHGGFDMTDFSAMDEVLKKVQDEALEILSSPQDVFITIEFARDDYYQALKSFRQDLLEQAYFLFIDADLKTCTQRIHKRIEQPANPDNHFVSDTILNEYYCKDNIPYMSNQFCTDFHIDPQRLKIIENTGTEKVFLEKVGNFLKQVRNFPIRLRDKDESRPIPDDPHLLMGAHS